jgi:hypothetical protein
MGFVSLGGIQLLLLLLVLLLAQGGESAFVYALLN